MRLYFLLSLWCLFLKISNALSTPAAPIQKQIPITVISGFLGSGKTTLLKNLLENKEGLKIAVIVNDVASVNIDSKLVSEGNTADGMVQLQNGCACCSLSDELLGGVSELVTLSDIRGESDTFDHIVVELSGVADPKGVRSQFQEAIFYNMPIMERVRLDTMVTVVDCSVFLKHLRSVKAASPEETPELFYREGEEIPDESENGDWMDDMPPLLEALLAGDSTTTNTPTQEQNAVADLLVSQTETADFVLLNKVDLVDTAEDLETIDQIVTALNAKATVKRATFADVALGSILAVAGGNGVVEAGVVDDHRDAIQAANSHTHSSHNHASVDADQQDESHHSHSHDHACEAENCEDSHSHNHNNHAADDCNDPDCTDSSHSHNNNHHSVEDCNDPDCKDPSHSHSHHSHEPTTLKQLGIGSFVYRARKPFHPQRLVSFLRYLPISRGLPEKTPSEPSMPISDEAEEALLNVVRSKGFVWMGDSNVAANYWSHAGCSFELQCLGRWWSTLSRAEWPPEAVATILADYDDANHEEDSDESVGDRRQEVVFIGPGLSKQGRQEDIVKCLDQCLLDEREWKEFKTKKSDEASLRSLFAASLSSKMLSY